MKGKNSFETKTAAFGRGLYYLYLKIMYRPKVYYENRKIKDEIDKGNVILIGNHVGHNDGQMFYMLFKNSVLLIAKDWADKRLLRWITSGGHFLPVDRNGMDITWISGAREEMSKGRNMIIFPEGHTSKTGMDEFKPGFAMLAVLTNARVVPVYNDGQYHKLLGRRVRYYVGEPLELTAEGKGLSADYLREESARFQAVIQEMCDKHAKN